VELEMPHMPIVSKLHIFSNLIIRYFIIELLRLHLKIGFHSSWEGRGE
jgi:hypothetical protein